MPFLFGRVNALLYFILPSEAKVSSRVEQQSSEAVDYAYNTTF
jgi:hypothetical protein